jgi:hypothetical protein
MHLGSYILGARQPVTRSLRVVGAAFLPEGLLALVSVPLMVLSPAVSVSGFYFAAAAIVIQVVSGIGALVLAIVGMRRLNGFTWRRSLVLFAFMPFVVVVFLVVVQQLRSLG